MFDPKNEDDVKKAYDYVKGKVDNYHGSSMYSDEWDRFAKRLKAYRCQHDTNAPKWRSKLHFATFFMGCKALDAQFKRSHRNDPFVWISLENGGKVDAAATEKAKIAHYDINHDLYISNFQQTLNKMYWYLELIGNCVGREYVYSDQVESVQRAANVDGYGIQSGVREESSINRKEHTKTEIIHPLNFAHDPTKSDFKESRWGAIRFETQPIEIYKMLKNDLYYQPGVEELIKELEKNENPGGWTVGKDTFFCESYDSKSTAINSLVLSEYSGDLNYKGNQDDNNLYYCLFSKSHNKILSIRKSKFVRHHFWKLSVFQDPYGPYCIGPCDTLLPLNYWKNSSANQYNDYTNGVLKYLWEVNPGNIIGGVNSLVNALPGGLILTEDTGFGNAIKPLNRDRNSLPPVGDILNMIEQEIQSSGPSSNLRGKASNQLQDTATGIGLMAQREDTMIDALQDEIDLGICDCIQMKISNRAAFMTQPIIGEAFEGKPPVRYFPWELSGVDYTAKVRRESSDIQSGKYMSFLKLVMGLVQSQAVPISTAVKLARRVGYAMGIDEVDEMLPEPQPVNLNPMASPAGPAQIPAPVAQGVENAMAMA